MARCVEWLTDASLPTQIRKRILVKTNRLAFLAWTTPALAIALLTATTGRGQNVIAWGNNTYKQTNVPLSATNVVAVAAGAYTAWLCASTAPWFAGALALPPIFRLVLRMRRRLPPACRTTWPCWPIRAWLPGVTTHIGQTHVPAAATNVVAVAAGYYHNLALRADGTVVAWGKNTTGQCRCPLRSKQYRRRRGRGGA